MFYLCQFITYRIKLSINLVELIFYIGAGKHMFKVINKNNRLISWVLNWMSSTLTIKTLHRDQWNHSSIFNVNFKHILTMHAANQPTAFTDNFEHVFVQLVERILFMQRYKLIFTKHFECNNCSLHLRWSFPLRVSSVSVTKPELNTQTNCRHKLISQKNPIIEIW